MLRLLLALLLALPGLLAAAQPDVVLITLDTTRADALSCYGGPLAKTPFLDTLAVRSIRFERAYTPVPLTLPAHASILTGLYPFTHGIRENFADSLNPKYPTLATLLKAQGYSTKAVIASPALDHFFGLSQGFDEYDDVMSSAGAERKANEVTNRALSMLTTLQSPYFLWVHYYDPHYPYSPPEGMALSNPYYGEAAYMDREIGRLLARIDLNTTLIVVAGDHGESLGEHQELEHGVLLYESAVRIPFLVHFPGQDTPIVSKTYVSLIDIAPTILKTLGIPITKSMSNVSVKDLIQSKPIYLETVFPMTGYRWSPLKGVIWHRHKMIYSSSLSELYDLEKDRTESQNNADEQAELMVEMRNAMDSLNAEPLSSLHFDLARNLPAELKKQIESLGYLAGPSFSTVKVAASMPHPKDMADAIGFIQHEAPKLLDEGKSREVIKGVKPILQRDPNNWLAMNLAGEAYASMGNIERALKIFDQALQIMPTAPPILGNKGRMLYLLKRYSESEAEIVKALQFDPLYIQGYTYLFDTFLAQGKLDEAEQILLNAKKKNIIFADLQISEGLLQIKKGNYDEAITVLELVLPSEPNNPIILYNLSYCYHQAGRTKIAWDYMARALEAAPNDLYMLNTAFRIAIRYGKYAEARRIADTLTRLYPTTEEARWIRERLTELP